MRNTSKPLTLGKLDSARRQLETAALLFFNSLDVVAIHTLVAAAYEILKDLAPDTAASTMIEGSIQALGDEALAKEVRSEVRKAQNFFKHADSDRSDLLEFDPALSELLLIDSYYMLLRATGEDPVVLRAFGQWFAIHHPSVTSRLPQKNQSVYDRARRVFASKPRLDFLKEFQRRAGELHH